MSKLLVSVRNALEARMAVAAGVDLIDVKEPNLGSLGAASFQTILEIFEEVGDTVPLSVALGELTDSPRIDPSALSGVSFAKLGLAQCGGSSDWQRQWERVLDGLPTTVGRVAVVYADATIANSPPEQVILKAAVKLGCRAVLLDTWSKSGGPVTRRWSLERIRRFVLAVQESHMIAVVGGSLSGESLEQVLGLSPDFVAVRGAVCAGERTGPLCPLRMADLKSRLASVSHKAFGNTRELPECVSSQQSVA
jgi:(5-formylfuran-3-yl)methyl phosphate synthase